MEIQSLGPVFSGVLGGALATLLCAAWSRWVPEVCNRKSAATLLNQYRLLNIIGGALFFGGLVLGIALYQLGYFQHTDWRGMGLAFGVACTAPLVVLPALAVLTGRSAKEALVAFAISQRTPVLVLYVLLVTGAGLLVTTVVSIAGT